MGQEGSGENKGHRRPEEPSGNQEVKTMAALINAAIPFLVGVYCLLVGFRIVGSKPGVNPKYDRWHTRFGPFLKLAGPVLMAVAVFLLVLGSGRQ
jgi:hypothetical protein